MKRERQEWIYIKNFWPKAKRCSNCNTFHFELLCIPRRGIKLCPRCAQLFGYHWDAYLSEDLVKACEVVK